jgi:hypothetical protein
LSADTLPPDNGGKGLFAARESGADPPLSGEGGGGTSALRPCSAMDEEFMFSCRNEKKRYKNFPDGRAGSAPPRRGAEFAHAGRARWRAASAQTRPTGGALRVSNLWWKRPSAGGQQDPQRRFTRLLSQVLCASPLTCVSERLSQSAVPTWFAPETPSGLSDRSSSCRPQRRVTKLPAAPTRRWCVGERQGGERDVSR